MMSNNGYLFTVLIIIILGYIVQKSKKPDFHVPIVSVRQNRLRNNLTLLGTNDLHSSVRGMGLQLYPELIKGGYSKLVHLINTIR